MRRLSTRRPNRPEPRFCGHRLPCARLRRGFRPPPFPSRPRRRLPRGWLREQRRAARPEHAVPERRPLASLPRRSLCAASPVQELRHVDVENDVSGSWPCGDLIGILVDRDEILDLGIEGVFVQLFEIRDRLEHRRDIPKRGEAWMADTVFMTLSGLKRSFTRKMRREGPAASRSSSSWTR